MQDTERTMLNHKDLRARGAYWSHRMGRRFLTPVAFDGKYPLFDLAEVERVEASAEFKAVSVQAQEAREAQVAGEATNQDRPRGMPRREWELLRLFQARDQELADVLDVDAMATPEDMVGFARCPGCGFSLPAKQFTKDHIIPKAKGGSNDKANIQPLCIACNTAKGSLIMVGFPLMWQRRRVSGEIRCHICEYTLPAAQFSKTRVRLDRGNKAAPFWDVCLKCLNSWGSALNLDIGLKKYVKMRGHLNPGKLSRA